MSDTWPRDTFSRRVQRWLLLDQLVREGLAHEGPRVIDLALVRRKISLRELARRTGLSATYLCRVLYGDARISASAYLKVRAVCDGK